MERSRYCLLIPALHFLATIALALSVHRANCLNVWTCKGDYGFWMSASLYGSHLIAASKWLTPALFFLCLFRKKNFTRDRFVLGLFVVSLVLFATDPIRHHLIEFLERDWNAPVELGA